jgi:nucleotide-binding universal stress UspA family protein
MSKEMKGLFHPAKILVPLDFSSSSEASLETAGDLAKLFGSELLLLHVVPVLPNLACDAYFPEEKFIAQFRQDAEAKLTKLVAGLQAAGRSASFCIEVGNDVVGNILHVLRREQADMLVFSTHGMSGWRPVVFGSIAEKVMKLAECPVLLLRTKEPVSHWVPESITYEAAQTIMA